MNQLKKGKYFGSHKSILAFDDIVVTNTEYTHEKVDWHYHENAYFTYLIAGKLFEANKKESYHLTPGTLLFHNWQDPHYNIKYPGYTQGFHIEIERAWFNNHLIPHDGFEGSVRLDHPIVRELFDKIYLETKIIDEHTYLSIELLLTAIFDKMHNPAQRLRSAHPRWVGVIKDILHSQQSNKLTLTGLSAAAGVHPVHLSREFSNYFETTLGDYIRRLKTVQAAALLKNKRSSLTEIAYQCRFSDQSHFIRTFKRYYHTTPLAYRKLVLGC